VLILKGKTKAQKQAAYLVSVHQFPSVKKMSNAQAPLDVQAVLSEPAPPSKSVDLSKLTYDQVLQLRTAIASLCIASRAASESMKQALVLQPGESRSALLAEMQGSLFRIRQAMKVALDVVG
jgi:hypothetical protein